MNIVKNRNGAHLSIALSGRLDTNTSPQLESEMELDGVTEITFDLAGLEYLSSAGLRVLLSAQKAMIACGGKMTITNPNPTVKGIFDITGCSDIFTIA